MILALDYLWPDLSGGNDLQMFRHRDDIECVELNPPVTKSPYRAPLPVHAGTLGELSKAVAAGRYSALFLGCPPPTWNARKNLGANLAKGAKYFLRDASAIHKWRIWQRALSDWSDKLPTAGFDTSDRLVLDNSRFAAVDASRVYFKRELPQNPGNAFLYTTSRAEDVTNIYRQPMFAPKIPKLRPFSLGLSDDDYERLSQVDEKKDMDVFFVGETVNKPSREKGLALLKQLQAEGFRVDLPTERMDRETFLRRIARAHLCWSPEGAGYDCYRTYEGAALGCVPLLQYPTIQRYAPFTDGVDSLYYGADDDSLLQVARRALADRGKLVEMGRRARARVRDSHTAARRFDYVMRELGALSSRA